MPARVALRVVAVALGAVAVASPGELRSAAAAELTLGVDPVTGVITGHYESGTGWDAEREAPRFTCIFFFRGERSKAPPYAIRSWYPADTDPADVIEGEIRLADDGELTIRLTEEHGGCWNVRRFAEAAGAAFFDPKPGGWTSVRVVAADRAHFHDAPRADARRKAYVTGGDVLRVHASSEGWVDAEYARWKPQQPQPRLVRGWIRETDLFPDRPPGDPERRK